MECLFSMSDIMLVGSVISGSQTISIVLVLGATAAMLIATRRKMREARNSPKTYAREQISRIREERELGNQINLAMLELEKTAREVNAQIETKLVKLDTLIRHADARIDKLERLIRQSQGEPVVDVIVNDKVSSESQPDGSVRVTPDNLRTLVFQLADAGRSVADIARQVSRPAGEIELLLRLRPAIAL